MRIAVVLSFTLSSGVALAVNPVAKLHLENLYQNQFDCHGASFESARCVALEGAYAAAGFGDLGFNTRPTIEFTTSAGLVYTAALDTQLVSLSICGVHPDAVEVGLFSVTDFGTGLSFNFEVPQVPFVDANGCVAFTAPFTATLLATRELISVESFGGGTWLVDARGPGQVTLDLGHFSVR